MSLIYSLIIFVSALGHALKLVERDSPAVVGTPISRRSSGYHDIRHQGQLRRQAGTINLGITNEVFLYFANVSIGTPPQQFSLHLDTGSSDTWVNTGSSGICASHHENCYISGIFTPNASSTYRYLNSGFNITYLDGSSALGDFVTDTVRFANVTLKNQQFAIGYTSSKYQGVLGLGYISNEGLNTDTNAQFYPNLPQALKDRGLINSVAFSVWLNDLYASTGSLLFGGVDTTKYMGQLQTVPVIPVNGKYMQLDIGLTGVGLDGNANSITGNRSIPVLLDSGTTISYLPQDISDRLYSEFDVHDDPQAPAGIIDCSAPGLNRTVNFSFSTAMISVPIHELVILGGYDDNAQPVCLFGITADNGYSVLGDSFLRSAYVVYDLKNNEISLAQTNLQGSNSSNIVEIQDDVNSLPMATPVPDPVTTATSVPTGEVMIIGNPGMAVTTTATMTGGGAPAATHGPLKAVGAIALLGFNLIGAI